VNLLVVGVSHRTAGVPLLERLAVSAEELPGLVARLLAQPYLGEALVLSTCNRVEVYAAVSGFHGGLSDIGAVLADKAGCPLSELAPHLYVHYDAEAVRHAFRVACGLDSMVVGEAQILGQLRDAYTVAAERGSVGRLLHELMQQALRVGKRAHTETGIDRAGQSIVSAALQLGAELMGGTFPTRALVVGAGAMGALSLATLRRDGATELYVTNRTPERAARLAATYGATAVPYAELASTLPAVDAVVCATASPDFVLTAGMLAGRPGGKPLLILDLAVPRDVAPGVGDLPGVTLVDLARLDAATADPADGGDAAGAEPWAAGAAVGIRSLAFGATAGEVRAAEDIVTAEVDAYLTWLRGSDVAPTVAALRARADEVVATELMRFNQRRPELTDEQRADVAHAVHRIVQRLLHAPTVRVRELAAGPGGEAYAAALRELFDLYVPDEIDPVRAGEVAPR
jgi:glutamyl-tRNA reductase